MLPFSRGIAAINYAFLLIKYLFLLLILAFKINSDLRIIIEKQYQI
jgi:hypothetical protein